MLLPVPLAPAAAQAPVPASADTAPPAGPRIPGPGPMSPALLPFDAGVPTGSRLDTLPCLECNPPRRFWMAVGNVMVAQFVPFFISNVITKETWARVGPTTWRNNFYYPWQWDDNNFQNNQFAHSYQGSLYYNAARTNGYNFWGAALWPVAGSLMWEYFFEAWAPSPNDFINTTVGGIVLGETLFRLSRLTLDNTSHGPERALREIGSGLLNPISGLNRVLRGETARVSANPPEWRPSAIIGVLDVGARRTTQSIGGGPDVTGSAQWNVSFLLSYGDPVKDLSRKPFSYFALRADLAGPSNGGLVNQLSARGSLAAWPLGESGRHQIAVSLEYDYFNNPAFEYGGQSVQLGLVSAIGAPGKTWWGQTSLLFNGVLLGAVRSDYYSAIEGRDYDYGPGLGTIVSGRLLYKNKIQLTAGYTGLWIHTVDGTKSVHYQDAILAELRYWASRRIGLGISYTGYDRKSEYADNLDVEQTSSFLRAFASMAIPGLPLP